MVETPSAQQNPKLGRPERDLRGKLIGHIHASWEPIGSQKLPTKDWRNHSWVHPRFSRQCNELPNVVDADVIGAFLSRTTCESLVHKLGCKGPQTTKELLNITTSHASGEEAVGAIFNRLKGKAKRDEDAGEGASNRSVKKKNKKQQHEGSLMAAADRRGGRKPTEGTPNHFKKLLEGHARTMPSWLNICTRTVA